MTRHPPIIYSKGLNFLSASHATPHDALARDLVACEAEWKIYAEALGRRELTPADGMALFVATLTDGAFDSPASEHVAATSSLEVRQQMFYRLSELCREALRYATPYLADVCKLAGPTAVRGALAAATRAVEAGNDPRYFF